MTEKIILLTGSTDGIGLETAKMLVSQGHTVLVHGRNPEKLENAVKILSALPGDGHIESYMADLSYMANVEELAVAVSKQHSKLDVLINNAGIFKTAHTITQDGFDVRFAVNTLAPYLLTKRLLPLFSTSGRIINLSSAAQAPVNPEALAGQIELADMDAYAQSKLAITMWSHHMAQSLKESGPSIISVNPGSMLGSKMVQDGFGVAGNDISIGVDILVRASLADEFAMVSGQYFDNDSGQFTSPHPGAFDPSKTQEIVEIIENCLSSVLERVTD